MRKTTERESYDDIVVVDEENHIFHGHTGINGAGPADGQSKCSMDMLTGGTVRIC